MATAASAGCDRGVERSATSAPDEKNTSDARSAGPSAPIASRAAAVARCSSGRRSPCCRRVDQDHRLRARRLRRRRPARRAGRTAARTPATISASAASRSSSSGQFADPPALHRLIGNPLQEHQRRELDDVLPLALDQVNDHRHRQAASPSRNKGLRKTLHRHAFRSLIANRNPESATQRTALELDSISS